MQNLVDPLTRTSENPQSSLLCSSKIDDNVLKSQLRFIHNSMDIIISSHSIQEQAIVITDNINHFDWMDNKNMTPEELIELISDI